MDPELEAIREYIRQNRDVYTRDAIDEQLRAAGYAPQKIEQAWSNAAEPPTEQSIPQQAGTTDPQLNAVGAYIRQNRGTYTREEIDAQLREAGYTPEEIEQAWGLVAEPAAEQPIPKGQRPLPPRGRFILAWVLLFIVLGIIQLATWLLATFSGSSTLLHQMIGWLNALFVVVEAGTLIGGLLLLSRNYPLGRVMLGLVVASIALGSIVAGTCFGVIR
jgi:uncharacterized protein Smg (DUF494 family)